MTPAVDTIGLAVTSSTGVMSLAIGRVSPPEPGTDGRAPLPVVDAVLDIEVATERRHAEELGPRLADLLDRAGLAAADLGWLAVDVGPGRFTGLRVGLATVRGLAFAIDLPVVGVTSLEIVAAGAEGPAGGERAATVTAVIDARRQEVFQQVFVGTDPAGPPQVGRPEDLAPQAQGIVLGDGFDRYRELYLDGPAGTGLLGRNPRAADLLALAAGRPTAPGTEVRPRYLREPDAVANIRTRPEAVAS